MKIFIQKRIRLGQSKLEHFRSLILDHLSSLEKEAGGIAKSLFAEMIAKGGPGLPVGSVREWKGRKFVKIAPGKWKPKYDGHTRAAKMAISAIKKKIASAKDPQEMLQIVLENRDRFSDKDGRPLPFVQELSAHVKAEQGKREKAANGGTHKTYASLKDNIHTILHGTADGKKALEGKYFHLADTPQFMKELDPPLKGKWFTVKYGIITHHKGKDEDHNLTEREWVELCDAIKKPFAITIDNGKHCLFTDVEHNGKPVMVVVTLNGKKIEVNAIKTAYGVKSIKNGKIIYKSKKTTPEQDVLLSRPNSAKNLSGSTSLLSPESKENSSKKDEAENRRSRSDAMKGNQNAKKDGGGDEPPIGRSNKISAEKQAKIKQKLDDLAVPMDENEYSREEYNKLFPRGTAKTPIKEVKLGDDLFYKLGRRDGGARRNLVGALYQTLTDPVAVIKEGDDDVYLKSFKAKGGNGRQSVVLSVEKDTNTGRVIVTAYKRKEKEVDKKIKKADGISYLKDDSGSRAASNEGEPLADTGDNWLSTASLESGEKSISEPKNLKEIREKYRAAKTVEGDNEDIQIGKEIIAGKWKLVEANVPTASHDEQTFHKTKGFPSNDDGSTINDRDYEHDKDAQEIVIEIAGDFDGQAVSFDSPVIVTKDGIVISGNNRTMSSKIAARKGTDKKYIEALTKKAKKFGFTEADIGKFKHPRVVFETDATPDYSTDEFAKYNRSGVKSMSPVEKAVKVSKTIKTETVSNVAAVIMDYDTLGDLYSDNKAAVKIFDTLQTQGVISPMDRPQYITDGGVTGAGKEFLETVLIGSVINEGNIRALNRDGCKSIRQKLVRAITPLIENKSMGGYSITKELNEAVDIAMQVATNKKQYDDVEDYSHQKKLFDAPDSAVSIEFAKKLEGTQHSFAEFMQSINGGLRAPANGEADIFLGGTETRDDVLTRILGIKKAIAKAVAGVIDFLRVRKSWDEGEHPREGGGQFAAKGENNNSGRAAELNSIADWLLTAEPVASISGNEFQKSNVDLVTQVETYFKSIGGSVERAEIGKIDLTKRGIKDSIAHGLGREKATAFMAVADIIKSGKISDHQTNWKGRGYNTYVIDAPIKIGDVEYIGEVVVEQNANKHNEYYLHEVEKKNKAQSAFKTTTEGSAPQASRLIIAQLLHDVNQQTTAKSLTWSGCPLQGRTKIHGMNISIEDEDKKLVFHKSFFESKKAPYRSLKPIGGMPLSGATSDISPADKSTAAGNRLSGRNGAPSKSLPESDEKSSEETMKKAVIGAIDFFRERKCRDVFAA